jgi:Dyp-type peroxidase family
MTIQLERSDIQGFVLSAYSHLPCANYLLLRMTDSESTRQWLKSLENQITTAEKKQEGFSLNVAFTSTGLSKLGFAAPEISTFSRSFAEGMISEHRSRILGDTDENEPKSWDWGSSANSVDILLLIFAADENGLASQVSLRTAEIESCGGLQMAAALAAGRHLDTKEHFGFEDGIGQPVIEGSGSELRQQERTHHATVIKTGEFILGYKNELKIPVALPNVKGMPSFGQNGTYLVFRQIEQDVAKFWNCLRDITQRADGANDDDALEYLAAKIVGRWKNGAPLAKYPHGVPQEDRAKINSENDFEYDEQDKKGFGCPIGAHIRRANPRDSLGPDPETALQSVKRHRILRRGRSYGDRIENYFVDDGVSRGLNFICLNSDIERQFEFIQQTWINNKTFAGLYDEVDPLVGKKDKDKNNDSFTVPNDPVRRRIHNLQDFVKTKGGAYFFMPGIRALHHLGRMNTQPDKSEAGSSVEV